MQDKKYSVHDGISSSMLSAFLWMTPRQWKETYIDRVGEKEGKLHFNQGSYLDCLMLNPNEVENNFFIGNINLSISDTIQRIVVNVHKKLLSLYKDQACLIDLSDLEDESTNKIVLECAGYENYGKGSYKEERILREIKCKGACEYFQYLCDAEGRVVISMEDHMNALNKKNALLDDEKTIPYFVKQEGELLFHHLQLFIDDAGLKRKCELDILRIVPSQRIVYVTDLKTSHSSFAFLDNVRKYSYATQISYYKDMLIKYITMGGLCNQELILPDDVLQYTFVCQNVVIDDREKIPYIYRYRDIDLDYYRFGSDFIEDGQMYVRHRTGWENDLNTIRKHLSLNQWNYPLSHIQNGFLTLNLLGGYVE